MHIFYKDDFYIRNNANKIILKLEKIIERLEKVFEAETNSNKTQQIIDACTPKRDFEKCEIQEKLKRLK